MNIELYINDAWQRLESDKETNTLTLSYTEDSLVNPSDYFSDFSYPFKVPKTSRNNILLQHIGELDSSSTANRVYEYRLHGEDDSVISEGNATISNITLNEYTLQLNGSLGIAFNKLIKSGFAESDDPEYYQLPDIISWNGSDYTAKVELNAKCVYTSFNVNSNFIPFEMADLFAAYGDLFFCYYFMVENYSQLPEQYAWVSSFVGFLPQMQGRYKNFDSSKWANGNTIQPLFGEIGDSETIDVGEGATEWQMQQFRSYYQTPFVYVQKLWEIYKAYCQTITGYALELDSRWYNENNVMLIDCVYTLQNIGNSEKVTPSVVSSNTRTGESNHINFPPNSNYNHSTHRITYLNDDNYFMSFYSDAQVVEKNRLLNCTLEVPIVFENNFSQLFAQATAYNRREDGNLQFDNCIAYNQKNPIYVHWEIVDESYNVVYDDTRPFVIVPLVKTGTYTEEWVADYRSTYEQYADCVLVYYKPDFVYENHARPDSCSNPNNTAHFGTVQLAATWQNNIGNGTYRIKFKMKFLFDLVPFVQFFPQQAQGDHLDGDGYFDYFSSQYGSHQSYGGYCNPLDNDDAYIKYVADYSIKTDLYEPTRSGRHITTADLFADEKPFNVLLKYSKMMDFVWKIDEGAKQITVLRRYDYLDDCTADGFYNLTDKINIEKGLTVEPQTFHGDRVLFEFVEGSDKYSKEYKKKYGNPYGSLTVYTVDKTTTEPIKVFSKDTSKFLSPIVATDIVQTRKNLQLMNFVKEETPIAFPSNMSDNGEFAGDTGVFYLRSYKWELQKDNFTHYTDPKPYVLITDDSEGEVQSDTYCWQNDDIANTHGFKTHYMPQYFSHTRNRCDSIWFGEPREVYYDIPQEVLDNGVSVFDTEWKNWISENYSLQNKRVTCYAHLTGVEYVRLKANPLVLIRDAVYILEKMEYNPSSKIAKLVLRGLSQSPNFNE